MLDADIGEDTATTVGGSGATAMAGCLLWASVDGRVGACESGAPPAAQICANGQSVLALGTRRKKTRRERRAARPQQSCKFTQGIDAQSSEQGERETGGAT